MKIVIAFHHPFVLWTAPAWFGDRLRADFPEHAVLQTSSYDDLGDAVSDADILLGWSIRPDQFARARRLQWIHSSAAAVHQLMFPELINSPVVVSNSRSVHAPVVAEHALALVFALAKRLPQCRDYQHSATWAQQAIFEEKPTVRELRDSTVCLIGLGSIGREFSQRARALGMRVIAVREHPEKGTGDADQVFGRDQLNHALSLADFVVLAAPLTTATHHIINAASLAAMRPHSYLINVGRGPLIDDSDLVSALREKRIAGAALDVFAEEPLPASSPYWQMKNVLITPHIAAVSDKLWERQYALISENLKRFLAHQPLQGIVDKSKGY
ncbi:MAG TPA: D-2-hydroxyacid dehydrogenase [Terriglobales bacterium]|nr:D-2-hydroxyacid dehydrogenase [Terriglobales bacterium]